MSGYPEAAKLHGNDYTYQLAPRAKIFRRDAGSVETLQDLQKLMRYMCLRQYCADLCDTNIELHVVAKTTMGLAIHWQMEPPTPLRLGRNGTPKLGVHLIETALLQTRFGSNCTPDGRCDRRQDCDEQARAELQRGTGRQWHL